MQATKSEALDILKHWMEEQYLVGYGSYHPSLIQFVGFGFITTISDEQIVIGFEDRPAPAAPESRLELNLNGAEYAYSDLRQLPFGDRDTIESAILIKSRFGLEIMIARLTDEDARDYVEHWNETD